MATMLPPPITLPPTTPPFEELGVLADDEDRAQAHDGR
jgi:hypothetical protein